MNQGQYKQEYPYCSQAIQTCQLTLSTTAVPKIRFLKCPDKMSEQAQKCSDIMEFWSDIDRNIFCYMDTCPHKVMFGQTSAKNGWKFQTLQCRQSRTFN